MPIADSLLMEFDQECASIQKVLERVPEDKLTWKPHPKSMSLGTLALHVATAPGNMAAAAAQDTFEFAGGRATEAKSRKEILDAWTQSQAKVKEVLGKMDDARIMAPWTAKVNGKEIMTVPRVGVFRRIVLNHVYHHRGQLSVYLRLLDVPVPSIYGPSADDNPFA